MSLFKGIQRKVNIKDLKMQMLTISFKKLLFTFNLKYQWSSRPGLLIIMPTSQKESSVIQICRRSTVGNKAEKFRNLQLIQHFLLGRTAII